MRTLLKIGLVLSVVCSAQTLTAQGPLRKAIQNGVKNLPFNKNKSKKTEQKKTTNSLWLTENNGPWLVMAASFFGAEGEVQARDLVKEFRTRYKVPAYLHRTKIELGQAESRFPEYDKESKSLRPKKMAYNSSPSEYNEVAVLVGDFPSYMDKNAQKLLKQIKYAQPETLKIQQGKRTYQRMGALRQVLAVASGDAEAKKKGPMRGAFLITNPLIPDEFFEQNTQDEFIMKLNKDIEFSLLKCPKPYSVKVATFRGKSTWNVKEIEKEQKVFQRNKMLGKQIESELTIAAAKAHKLTQALRKRGFEAYEFHDRFESTVYIGSFSKVGDMRRDGKIEIDPRIHQIVNQFKATEQSMPGLRGVMKPKSLPELPKVTFDLQPVPIKIPEYQVASKFNNRNYR